MSLLLTLTSLVSHVPTYGRCVDNCCVPPKDPTISQVIYLKGSGGLELHTDTLKTGQILDFDAVFRDDIDPSTFDLYVGCGGCMPSDPIVVDPYNFSEYQEVEVEPFTQTAYRSAFPKEQRTFDTALLANCSQGHFTIRLVDRDADTRETPIVWGPVIGLAEEFTVLELLQFPIYVLRNHGDSWNGLWYTYWIWVAAGVPLLLLVLRLATTGCSINALCGQCSVRGVLYGLALLGFLSAALEMLTHLIYVQVGHPVGWGFWVALIAVNGIANGFPILLILIILCGMRRGGCLGSPWWFPLEFLSGVSFLFLFGAGFYLGPAALALAALVRGGHALCGRKTASAPSPPRAEIVVEDIIKPPPVARQRGYACEKNADGTRCKI